MLESQTQAMVSKGEGQFGLALMQSIAWISTATEIEQFEVLKTAAKYQFMAPGYML